MNITLRRCNLKFPGVIQSGNYTPAIIDANGMDALVVTLAVIEGSWTAAVVNIRHGSDPSGPFFDYSPPVIINTASTSKSSGLCAVLSRYLAVEVVTGEGSALYADVSVNMRPSGIGSAVAT